MSTAPFQELLDLIPEATTGEPVAEFKKALANTHQKVRVSAATKTYKLACKWECCREKGKTTLCQKLCAE